MTAISRVGRHSSAPVLDIDLYADHVLADSSPAFARIREAGPAVWLPRHRMYAVGRFEHVHAALRDAETFISGRGVAANSVSNRLGQGTTLFSDGHEHDRQRRILREQLGPRALKEIRERIDARADQVVAQLCGCGWFDAVRDFSSRLPTGVVADLVGVRASSERMLRWAAATFDLLGPLNRRSALAAPTSLGLLLYTLRLTPRRVSSRSWAAAVFEARDRGAVGTRQARGLVIDLVAPSLDTTILASTHLLWALSRNPDAWEQIAAAPSLIPAAVLETVRLASPIRGFTRCLSRERELEGVVLPRGARVALLYGAANLDETRFPDPEAFDIHRPNGAHLGWGTGAHACAGANLAKLEMQALMRAMAPRVRSVATRDPARLRNNTLQGFSRLTARFR
jgi:cytochrome P450